MQRLAITKAPQVKVVTVPNTELIQISVESPNPALAQGAANALADILIVQGKELYSGGGKSSLEILSDQLAQADAELKQARQNFEDLVAQSPDATEEIDTANRTIDLKEKTYTMVLDQYEQARLRDALRANTISVVDPAALPLFPSKPRALINISLGILVGLCGGIGLAFLLENINPCLYSSVQIESITGMMLLSKIPSVSRKYLLPAKKDKRVLNKSFQDAFQRLCFNLITRDPNGFIDASLRTILVTSAEASEGKSTVVTHLALTLAQAGQKVILVDADMRIPSLYRILELPKNPGLSNFLRQKASLKDVVKKNCYPGLDLITSGPTPSNPTELLGSPTMKALIEELASQYDIVLVDAPAFLPVTDAAVLAQLLDGVILVVRRISIHQSALQEVCRRISDIKPRPIGMVVNRAEQDGYYNYYYNGR